MKRIFNQYWYFILSNSNEFNICELLRPYVTNINLLLDFGLCLSYIDIFSIKKRFKILEFVYEVKEKNYFTYKHRTRNKEETTYRQNGEALSVTAAPRAINVEAHFYH